MKYKPGDKVRVVGNSTYHEFEIQKVVTIKEAYGYESPYNYKCKNKDDWWYMMEVDLELVEAYTDSVKSLARSILSLYDGRPETEILKDIKTLCEGELKK